MLEQLTLRHFILVKEQIIEFGNGFNVLTGETGAGKSLIVKSLGLLSGQQASEDLIHPDADSAYIEAVFYMPGRIIDGVELEDDRFIVARKLFRNRASANKINGESVSLKVMKDVMKQVVFLSSQHQVYELLNTANHRTFFDDSMGADFTTLLTDYQAAFGQLKQAKHAYNKAVTEQESLAHEQAELEANIKDIDAQHFYQAEEDELEAQQKQCESLQGKRERVSQLLTDVAQATDVVSRIDSQLSALLQQPSSRCDTMLNTLQDLHQEMMAEQQEIDYLETMDLQGINQRLSHIFTYKTKYKVQTLGQLLEVSESAKQTLQDLNNANNQVQELKHQQTACQEQVQALVNKIRDTRDVHSKVFEQRMMDQLGPLGLAEAVFKVAISPLDAPTEYGQDSISFLFSANPNMPLRPLKANASGGELSRVMLALLVTNDGVVSQPVVLFDEIDVGIGGVTANYIGTVLAELAQGCQLIVVTHLPQIARCAGMHFKIYKQHVLDKKGSHAFDTCVSINKLVKEDVVTELQRMVGGETVTSLIT